MGKQPLDISDAESHVMEVLWQHQGAVSADDVVAALVSQQQWQEATVKTLLNRLLKKGAVSAEKDGRRYLYTAVLEREHWVSSQSSGMLDRLFGGRVAPLVAHFGKHRRLSKTDIADLKRLIEELGDDK
jgi:BlaI family penicillinase repressor